MVLKKLFVTKYLKETHLLLLKSICNYYQLKYSSDINRKEKGFIWAISPDNKTRRLAPDSRFYDFTHDVYMDTEVVDGLDPRNYDQIF